MMHALRTMIAAQREADRFENNGDFTEAQNPETSSEGSPSTSRHVTVVFVESAAHN